jgi:hypothetical protein
MSFPTSYVKLDDGSWGIRIPGPNGKCTPGDVVSVTTRSGEVKRETLATFQGRNRYGDQLWSVVAQARVPQAEAQVGQLDGVLALFAKAKTHLKRPAIVLAVPNINIIDREEDAYDPDAPRRPFTVRLTIASAQAKVPGSLTVTTGEYTTTNDYGEPAREWLGRVTVDGTYQPARAANGRTDAIARRLGELASDPAKVAAEHGRLTGRCCFCNRALSDERSTAVGYGKTCAAHFGVPWGSKPATFAGEAV